jgi:hypothetical protein
MVVHEDERPRLKQYEENPNLMKSKVAWKMIHKEGYPVYISSNTKMITKARESIMLVEIEPIEEEEYITSTSDSYFDPSTRGSA